MSTYTTNVHHRIQENISISRCPHNELSDGITNQRVIFANENNIYNGKFVGTISAENAILQQATINNSQLNGSTIVDTIISGSKLVDTQISVGERWLRIEDIVDRLDNHDDEINYLSTEISSNDYDISCIQLSVNDIVNGPSGIIAISSDITTKLSQKISNDISTAISELSITIDDRLSTQYNDLTNQLSSVSSDLCSVIGSADESLNEIKNDIRGHLNHKGHIDLTNGLYENNLKLSTIFGLFYNVIQTDPPAYLSNVSLNYGWMYKICTIEPYYTSDDPSFVLENNDYLIICNHNTSLSCIDISSITPNDIDIIESVYEDSFRKSLSNHVLCSNIFDATQTFNNAVIKNLTVDNQYNSTSSLIEQLSVKNSIIDSLSVPNSDSLYIGSNTLCTTLSNEITLSVSSAINSLSINLTDKIDNLSDSLSNEIESLSSNLSNEIESLSSNLSNEIKLLSAQLSGDIDGLSVALSNDFGFGYNRDENIISARVAGNTLWFSANKFTEASMLSTVKIDIEVGTGNRILWLYFKTESGIDAVSVDLNEIMPLYQGEDGIDIHFQDSHYVVKANNTIARLSTITELDAEYKGAGKILTALYQTDGLVSAEFATIMSSDVSCLEEYVNTAVSTYIIPLSTSYGWNSDPLYYNGTPIVIHETIDTNTGIMYATPYCNNTPLASEVPFTEEHQSVVWQIFNTGIQLTGLTATRKDDYYILGNNFNKPIQPKLDFSILSTLDFYPLSNVNEDSDMSVLISAVISMRDMLSLLRNAVEQIK